MRKNRGLSQIIILFVNEQGLFQKRTIPNCAGRWWTAHSLEVLNGTEHAYIDCDSNFAYKTYHGTKNIND